MIRDATRPSVLVSAVAVGVAAAVVPLPHLILPLLCAAGLAVAIVAVSRPRSYRPPVVALPAVAVALGLLGLSLTPITAVRGPGNVTPADVLLFTSFGAGIAVAGIRLPATLPRVTWIGIALIWASALLASFGLGDGIAQNLTSALLIVAAMTAVPAVAVWTVTTQRRRDIVVSAWVVAAAVSALVALAERVGAGNLTALLGTEAFDGRVSGLTVHPNHLGMTSAMALPAALALAQLGQRSELRRVGMFGAPVLVAGVLLSGSRAAALGVVAGVLPWLWASVRRRRVKALAVAGAAVLAVLAFAGTTGSEYDSKPSVFVLVDRARDPGGFARSDEGREEFLQDGLRRLDAGVGLGRGYEDAVREHNIYLQLLLSGGVLGLAGLLAYLASSSLVAGWTPWTVAFAASFLIWPLEGLFQNNIRDRFLFVPLGLLLAQISIDRNSPDEGLARGARP